MKYIPITLLFAFVLFGQANGQNTPGDSIAVPPGWWLIPKTRVQLKFGGYVKFDLIHDFNPIASPDFFDVSKIPTDDSEGESTHLNAKETRLYVDLRAPSKAGEMRAFIEGDFYGSGGGLRLRHAYVEIGGKWLAGQTWSNFMDENIIPPTLDFEKPAAYAFVRHPIFRWKQSLSQDAYLSLALEEPSTNAQAPTTAGHFESPLPDFTARYRYTKNWGHVQLSAFAALLRYRFNAGGKDEVSLFGLNLSGQINVFEKDKLTYQGVYGPGVGRYRGGMSAALDNNGNLEALTDAAFTLGYQHFWSPVFSSLAIFNHGFIDELGGQPGSNAKMGNYVAVNFVWYFVENAFVGVEFLRGFREDIDGDDGTANRLQFSVSYTFN